MIEVVNGVRERCAISYAPVPPDDIIFDKDSVDKWIKDRKDELKDD